MPTSQNNTGLRLGTLIGLANLAPDVQARVWSWVSYQDISVHQLGDVSNGARLLEVDVVPGWASDPPITRGSIYYGLSDIGVRYTVVCVEDAEGVRWLEVNVVDPFAGQGDPTFVRPLPEAVGVPIFELDVAA